MVFADPRNDIAFRKIFGDQEELEEAFEVANRLKWSKAELDAYEVRAMYIQDERGRVDYALEKGKQIGIAEGEKKKALEMAGMMKKNNEPVDKIGQYTGLSEEEIDKL